MQHSQASLSLLQQKKYDVEDVMQNQCVTAQGYNR